MADKSDSGPSKESPRRAGRKGLRKRPILEVWRNSARIRCEHNDLLSQEVLSAVGDLAAAVAHETRNPLAGISGAMQLLRDALPEEDPRYQVIEEVLKQVGRLDRLVRDLLAFAHPMALSKQTLDVAPLVHALAERNAAQARARGVRINVRADRTALAYVDRGFFELAMQHVLNNAIEAAPDSGGNVWIGCEAMAAGARLTVEDDGPGISPDLLCLVFKPFFTTKPKGTGLGLALVKRIVDAHGGDIRIGPRAGGGTRVTLEFSKQGGRHGQG